MKENIRLLIDVFKRFKYYEWTTFLSFIAFAAFDYFGSEFLSILASLMGAVWVHTSAGNRQNTDDLLEFVNENNQESKTNQ